MGRIVDHFRNRFHILGKGDDLPGAPKKGAGALESLVAGGAEAEPGLRESDVKQQLEQSKEGLYRLIDEYFDKDAGLKEIADRILREGGDVMRAVANNDEEYLGRTPDSTGMLEVIVNTDGSRPSFMIKNDKVDLKSSPVGDWDGKIVARQDELKAALQCTGRINLNMRHIGTGFLVKKDLVVTNRHVLQAIAEQNGPEWVVNAAANIDFGYEFKTRESVNLRKIKKVVYAGAQFIDIRNIDHSKLDLAILQLESVPEDMLPLQLLDWDPSLTWGSPGTQVFIIGYPGDPGLSGINTYTGTLLDKLFRSTYGWKRLAPGRIIPSNTIDGSMAIAHDATTLGGNSGSLVVVLGDELNACGLHYGGDLETPRQNWGHILGYGLSQIKATHGDVGGMLE